MKNKTVIITGGSSGIGKVSVAQFAQQGANVYIWDIDENKGNATIEELKDLSGNVSFQRVNITNFNDVLTAAEEVFEQTGGIDVLINNAGITKDATLKKMSPEMWQQVIDVNLTGVFNCTKAIVPLMEQNGFGRIINTSSVVALYGNFGQSNYVATKTGVIGLTKVWARELGRKGITVNAVAPGFIATEMIETVPEKVIDGMLARTPLNRLGQPQDIAKTYQFLASDDASFITGTVISVDGGLTL